MAEEGLTLRIGGDASAALRAVDSVTKALRGAQAGAKESTSSFLGIGRAIQIWGDALKHVQGFASGTFKALVGDAIEAADQIGKLSQQTGIATSTLQKLKFAAEQNDASIQSLANGMKFLNRNIAQAAGGSKEALAAFQRIGVSAKDIAAGTVTAEGAMAKLADFMARKAVPESEKTAAAMALMGRGAVELAPMLKQGSRAIADLGGEAARLGAVLSDRAIGSIKQFKDNLDAFKTASIGLANIFLERVAPALEGVTGHIRVVLPKAIAAVRPFIEGFGDLVSDAMGRALDAAIAFGDWATGPASAAMIASWNNISAVFRGVADILSETFEPVLLAARRAWTDFVGNWTDSVGGLLADFPAIRELLERPPTFREWIDALVDMAAQVAVFAVDMKSGFLVALEHVTNWVAKSAAAFRVFVSNIGAVVVSVGPLIVALARKFADGFKNIVDMAIGLGKGIAAAIAAGLRGESISDAFMKPIDQALEQIATRAKERTREIDEAFAGIGRALEESGREYAQAAEQLDEMSQRRLGEVVKANEAERDSILEVAEATKERVHAYMDAIAAVTSPQQEAIDWLTRRLGTGGNASAPLAGGGGFAGPFGLGGGTGGSASGGAAGTGGGAGSDAGSPGARMRDAALAFLGGIQDVRGMFGPAGPSQREIRRRQASEASALNSDIERRRKEIRRGSFGEEQRLALDALAKDAKNRKKEMAERHRAERDAVKEQGREARRQAEDAARAKKDAQRRADDERRTQEMKDRLAGEGTGGGAIPALPKAGQAVADGLDAADIPDKGDMRSLLDNLAEQICKCVKNASTACCPPGSGDGGDGGGGDGGGNERRQFTFARPMPQTIQSGGGGGGGGSIPVKVEAVSGGAAKSMGKGVEDEKECCGAGGGPGGGGGAGPPGGKPGGHMGAPGGFGDGPGGGPGGGGPGGAGAGAVGGPGGAMGFAAANAAFRAGIISAAQYSQALAPAGFTQVFGQQGQTAGGISQLGAIYAPPGMSQQQAEALVPNLAMANAMFTGGQGPGTDATGQPIGFWDQFNQQILDAAAGDQTRPVSFLGPDGDVVVSDMNGDVVVSEPREMRVRADRVTLDRPMRVDLSDVDRYRGGLATPGMAEEVFRRLIGPQPTKTMQDVAESNEKLADSNERAAQESRPVNVTVNYTAPSGSGASSREQAEEIARLIGEAIELEMRKAQQGSV